MALGCCCNPTPPSQRKVGAAKVWQGWKAFNICDPCDVESVRYLQMEVEYKAQIDGEYTIGAGSEDFNDHASGITLAIDKDSGIVTKASCYGPTTTVFCTFEVPCSDVVPYVLGYINMPSRTNALCIGMNPCPTPALDTEGWTLYSSSDTEIVFRQQFVGPTEDCPLAPEGFFQYRFKLSNPYSYAECCDDSDGLLGHVSLLNAPEYGAFVTRDETYSVFEGWNYPLLSFPTLPCGVDDDICDYVDPRTNTGDVEIGLGPPLPWEEPCGAWRMFLADMAVQQKWMEKKVSVPSHNFFRPAHWDRFIPDDAGGGVYATSLDNTVPTAPIFTVASHGFSVADKVLVYFGTHDRSLWEVTATTATTVTLGNKEGFDVSLFDYAKARLPVLTDCSPVPVALLATQRYPSAWPILGRIGVTSATQNGADVDIVLASASSVGVGDSVTFDGVGSLTTHTVSAVTSTTAFTVSSATVGGYSGGGYAASTGAPAHTWNDDEPNGDYTIREFGSYAVAGAVENAGFGYAGIEVTGGNTIFRHATPALYPPLCVEEGQIVYVGCPPVSAEVVRVENFVNSPYSDYWEVEVAGEHPDATLWCLTDPLESQHNIATGAVMMITPDTQEADPHAGASGVFDMPPWPDADQSGKRNYKYIVQLMRDPLWVAPTLVCAGKNCNIEDHVDTQLYLPSICADDGTDIEADVCVYYRVHPLAPLVESIMTIPAGAPALPAGRSLSQPCIDFVWCSTLAPFAVLPARDGCTAADGRFADAYAYDV
jgi:hypothetical protein